MSHPELPDAELPELTPAQTESVRRLLAAARVNEPIPADVSERLDRVLLGLSTAAPTQPSLTPGRVIDLSARRRTQARNLLVAAAAVVAVGVAGPRLITGAGSDSSSTTSADRAVAPQSASEADSPPESAFGVKPEDPTAPELGAGDATTDSNTRADLLRSTIRPKHFRADARRVNEAATKLGLDGLTLADLDSCVTATDLPRQSRAIPVRYARRDAVLVLGEAVDGRQRATLLVCGEPTVRRTTFLPAL